MAPVFWFAWAKSLPLHGYLVDLSNEKCRHTAHSKGPLRSLTHTHTAKYTEHFRVSENETMSTTNVPGLRKEEKKKKKRNKKLGKIRIKHVGYHSPQTSPLCSCSYSALSCSYSCSVLHIIPYFSPRQLPSFATKKDRVRWLPFSLAPGPCLIPRRPVRLPVLGFLSLVASSRFVHSFFRLSRELVAGQVPTKGGNSHSRRNFHFS